MLTLSPSLRLTALLLQRSSSPVPNKLETQNLNLKSLTSLSYKTKHILIIEKLEQGNVWHFCLKNYN